MKAVFFLPFLIAVGYASITPRAITGPTKDYKCDDGSSIVTFTASYITRVITQAAKDKADKDSTAEAIEILTTLPECTVSKTTQRNNDFCQPKDYKNHPDSHTGLRLHFPDCPHGPWLEFPLLTDGKIYSGNKPPGRENPARVVFQYTNKDTAKFCGAVTHSTATSHGQFVSCASI